MRDNYFNISRFKYRKQLVCFFLFVPFILFGQNFVKGRIIDSTEKSIQGANVIIKSLQDNTIVKFTTSNENGNFQLNTITGLYELKISYLGYKTIIKNFEIQKRDFDFGLIVLEENNTELNEIILKAKNDGITQKDDITQYRIDHFLNGTEENLKDVINKLPGLGINERGKITANGKEIDKLLIEGEDLYRRQHQFATENISSEMIKNIELIRNYKDFESISKNDSTGVTALNVNIKDEFKNKFTGNTEGSVGIENKYKFNSPLFNIRKNIKFSLISSFNNTGEQPISIDDYNDLITDNTDTSTDGASSVMFTNLNDLPRFLSSGNNVDSRKTHFHTLSTVANLSKKIKINFYSIFNATNQSERFFQNTIIPSNNFSQNINEERTTAEKNIFFNAQLNTVYKINKTNILSFKNKFNLNNSIQRNNIQNNTVSIEENLKPRNYNFASLIDFKKRIKKNILTSRLLFNSENIENNIDITSNESFLDFEFNNDNFFLQQLHQKSTKTLGFNNNYKINLNKVSFSVFTNYSFDKSRIKSSIDDRVDFSNNISLTRFYSSSGLIFAYKPSKKVTYSAGINYNSIRDNFNDDSNRLNFAGLNASIKLSFSSNIIGKLSYEFSRELPIIDNLTPAIIIKNYRNLVQNDNVASNTLLPIHQISFSQFIFKPKSKFSFIFNSSYKFKTQSINNNISNTPTFTTTRNSFVDIDKMFNSFIFFEKGLEKMNLKISGSISYNNSKQNYLIDDISQLFINNITSGYTNLKYSIKKFPLTAVLGYQFTRNSFENANTKNRLISRKINLNLNSNITNRLSLNLNNSLLTFISNNNVRTFYDFSPELVYKKDKSNWDFRISGSNIFNLDNQLIVENDSRPSFLEERVTNILSGFILIGARLKF